MARRHEVAVAVFGSWMVIGLYLDGWAHAHQRPETFFTPWHGVLYSGFAAAVAFFVLDGFRQRDGSPIDRLMGIGFGLFMASAVGDFVWHAIFGIEVSLRALLSPTHLGLMTGGILMVTGPVRAAIARKTDRPSLREFAPTLVTITLLGLEVSFFLSYLSAFNVWSMASGEGYEVPMIATILVTNTLLVGLTLLTVEHWRPPLGTFAFMFGATAFGIQSQDDFFAPQHVIVAILAGLVADIVCNRAATPEQRVRNAGVVVPLALWSLWLVSVRLSGGIHVPAEIPGGILVLSVLEGWGLSVVVSGATETATSSTSVP